MPNVISPHSSKVDFMNASHGETYAFCINKLRRIWNILVDHLVCLPVIYVSWRLYVQGLKRHEHRQRASEAIGQNTK